MIKIFEATRSRGFPDLRGREKVDGNKGGTVSVRLTHEGRKKPEIEAEMQVSKYRLAVNEFRYSVCKISSSVENKSGLSSMDSKQRVRVIGELLAAQGDDKTFSGSCVERSKFVKNNRNTSHRGKRRTISKMLQRYHILVLLIPLACFSLVGLAMERSHEAEINQTSATFESTRTSPKDQIQSKQNSDDIHANQKQDRVAKLEDSRLFEGASSTKFTRINELDTFLDEMNQNELRKVASGRPIEDLFTPKPGDLLRSMAGPSNEPISRPTDPGQRPEPTRKAASDLEGRGRESGDGLEGSHSTERSSYAECALILQRTYVKNMGDPK